MEFTRGEGPDETIDSKKYWVQLGEIISEAMDDIQLAQKVDRVKRS